MRELTCSSWGQDHSVASTNPEILHPSAALHTLWVRQRAQHDGLLLDLESPEVFAEQRGSLLNQLGSFSCFIPVLCCQKCTKTASTCSKLKCLSCCYSLLPQDLQPQQRRHYVAVLDVLVQTNSQAFLSALHLQTYSSAHLVKTATQRHAIGTVPRASATETNDFYPNYPIGCISSCILLISAHFLITADMVC